MTLSEVVLTKLAEWPATSPGRQTLPIADEGAGWSMSVTADRHDEFACVLWEVSLRRTGAAPAAGPEALGGWASAAAEKLVSLLEPLAVYEVDAQRDEALLRTKSPVRRGSKVAYFEVSLKGTSEAVVRRFQGGWEPGKRRQQVAFSLTHEGVAKTVVDLASAQEEGEETAEGHAGG